MQESPFYRGGRWSIEPFATAVLVDSQNQSPLGHELSNSTESNVCACKQERRLVIIYCLLNTLVVLHNKSGYLFLYVISGGAYWHDSGSAHKLHVYTVPQSVY